MSKHNKNQEWEKFLMPMIDGFKKAGQAHRAHMRQMRQERSMTAKVPGEEQEQLKNVQQNEISHPQQIDQAKGGNDQNTYQEMQMNQTQQYNLLQSTYYKGPPMAQMSNQQNNNQQPAQNITQSAHYPSHQNQNNQNEEGFEGFTVFKANTKKGQPTLSQSEIYSSHFSQSVTDITKSQPIYPQSRVMILKSDALEFEFLEDNEQAVDNKTFEVNEVNNLKIVREKKTNPPEYKFQERICENHGQGINYICREDGCIKNSQQLLCPKCLRDHKGHNFLDIEEALNLIEVEQKQNSKGQQMIDRIEMNLAKDFKIIKQKVLQDLNNIEQLLAEACNCLKGQLQYKVREYEIRFANVLDGGLSKLYEAVNQVFMENSKLQSLDMSEFEQKIKQYNELIAHYQPKDEVIQVKCDNLPLNIRKEKIINLSTLAEQIEQALLLQHQKLLIDKDYLLINESKAIKLKGNPNQVQGQYLEVISIAKIQ